MPLLLADIRCLRGLGYQDFFVVIQGERRLRNVDGHCFFLTNSGCSVYEVRPAGCQFYPLVVDGGGRVSVDVGCQHRDKFKVTSVDARRLRSLVRRLRRERCIELL